MSSLLSGSSLANKGGSSRPARAYTCQLQPTTNFDKLSEVGKHAFPMLKAPSTTPHHILCSFPSHAPGASYILDCLATALRRHGAEKTHATTKEPPHEADTHDPRRLAVPDRRERAGADGHRRADRGNRRRRQSSRYRCGPAGRIEGLPGERQGVCAGNGHRAYRRQQASHRPRSPRST